MEDVRPMSSDALPADAPAPSRPATGRDRLRLLALAGMVPIWTDTVRFLPLRNTVMSTLVPGARLATLRDNSLGPAMVSPFTSRIVSPVRRPDLPAGELAVTAAMMVPDALPRPMLSAIS